MPNNRMVTSPKSGGKFEFNVEENGLVTIRMDGAVISENENIENVMSNYSEHGVPAELLDDHSVIKTLAERARHNEQ